MSNFLRIDPEGEETFQAGKDYRVLLDLNALGGADHVGTFPVSIKSIKFTLDKGGPVGDHTLSLKSLYCHYPYTAAAVTTLGDVNDDGEVNIADVGALIDFILSGAGAPTGADVNGDGEVNIADVSAVIDIILRQ